MKNTSNISWRLLKALSVCFLLSSSSCDKTEPPPDDPPCPYSPLPCATQEGKNTFGCYVNGQAFVADVPLTVGGVFEVNANYNSEDKKISIEGYFEHPNEDLEKISFRIFATNGLGEYSMHAFGSTKIGYSLLPSGIKYFHDTTNFGAVNLTALNTEEKFVSGTFEMQLKNAEYGADSLMTISDGRFDIRY